MLGLALGLVWVFWPGVPVELVCFSPLPWFWFQASPLYGFGALSISWLQGMEMQERSFCA